MKTEDIYVWDKNNPTNCYDYCKPSEVDAKLARANASREANIETYKSRIVNDPNNAEMWNRELERYKRAEYVAGDWEAFTAAQRQHLIGEIHEITEEEWYEALEVLPPANWGNYPGGFEMFYCIEAFAASYYSQYARKDGKYYTALVDITDKNTWINNRLTTA